jgi:hypothetical protein
MNERIKQLHDKAFDGIDILESGWFLIHNKKFAELIVRECVDIIQRESEKAIRNNTYMGDDVPASVTQWAIKKHFGVEE